MHPLHITCLTRPVVYQVQIKSTCMCILLRYMLEHMTVFIILCSIIAH